MKRAGAAAVAAALSAIILASSAEPAAAQQESPSRHEVRIQSVEVRATAAGPVVLLRVYKRVLPILVDAVVAESIQGALTRKRSPRPLTHDLMHAVLMGFDARVTQVVVTLKDKTYYAALTVAVDGTEKVFDSRSSDAVALALHFQAPILVSQELLDASGIDLEPAGTPL